MTALNERRENGEIILLDGGVSTEIQQRGVALDREVWSGIATGRIQTWYVKSTKIIFVRERR